MHYGVYVLCNNFDSSNQCGHGGGGFGMPA